MSGVMTKPMRIAFSFLLWIGCAWPAQAAVTITFWSHELGNSFPHAFFSLRGTVDATGQPVDANYGFTAKSVSPAILMGTVPGRLDISKPFYISTSDAQFSYVMTDAQYADILALVAAWDDKIGDGHYNLNRRNCVHFVQEAARRLGLAGLDHPELMKKPRSFLKAVASANADRVTVLGMSGKAYLASLPPLPALGSSIGQLPPAPALPTAPAPTAALPRSATSSTTSKSDS
ncbi:hypothetical protein ACH37Y_00430 [Sphingomonas paucimobilis]|jgi:hypothetical protein|uniref:DUF4105 domain-containing protein n=2 Tax=Sphingomonas paucimobilis TaxID=13689 RepID=A0A411LMW6_SPHPI|nr:MULTISPECIES: hypothetical protein [Sphingomonas]MBQ1478503.1 hypothetical protein [Sphingomonas sp.]RSU64465.1 hypothetical protein BRX36_13355 [Sphingomonas sp. S-NIH.Pt1_0416]NNG58443.1 hypothetical protein [Sphingomonas paucimobilis]QBE93675.1 hypothetical protein DRN02_018000 [Sphingomonas paucimobilis]QPS15596.1 hypothetical protein I6G65_14800 [Sphingomonas paucimobilis]